MDIVTRRPPSFSRPPDARDAGPREGPPWSPPRRRRSSNSRHRAEREPNNGSDKVGRRHETGSLWGRRSEKPGIVDADGRVRDLSGTIRDIDGETLSTESLDRLRAIDPATLPLVEEGVRLGVPVARVGNLVCIGLNYTDHAEERTPPSPRSRSSSTSTRAP